MKKIAFIFFLFIPILSFAQTKQEYCKQLESLHVILNRAHFSPVPVSDAYSERVYKLVFDIIDPNALLFSEEDIRSLETYKFLLDDEINSGQCGFFLKELDSLLNKRISQIESVLETKLDEPFVADDKNDTLYLKLSRRHRVERVNSEEMLEKRWDKYLKVQLLAELFPDSSSLNDYNVRDFETIKSEAQQIKKNLVTWEKAKLNKYRHAVLNFPVQLSEKLLQAYALANDPHTEFFNTTEHDLFQNSLSTKSFQFGISLKTDNDGNLIIARMDHSGPAFKTHQLHVGDVLENIYFKKKKKSYSLIKMNFDDFEKLMEEYADELTIVLTTKDKSGKRVEVLITKEKLAVESNSIRGYLLSGEKKVGYIALPSFYTDMYNDDQLGCANDLAKELIKLKEQGIEGFILDLRFNGGGSVREAASIIGLFVDEGPLCMFKSRFDRPRIMKDPNRGTVYDGPMVVLVNRLSASASELVCSALKDYRRAVIVGDTTFGKATAQFFLALDTLSQIKRSKPSYPGFIKITNNKIYNLSGTTYQKSGIIPDVPLPVHYIYK